MFVGTFFGHAVYMPDVDLENAEDANTLANAALFDFPKSQLSLDINQFYYLFRFAVRRVCYSLRFREHERAAQEPYEGADRFVNAIDGSTAWGMFKRPEEIQAAYDRIMAVPKLAPVFHRYVQRHLFAVMECERVLLAAFCVAGVDPPPRRRHRDNIAEEFWRVAATIIDLKKAEASHCSQ